MLSGCGALTDILASGARLLECACGPCIGMGFSPASGGVSVRTFNRNFEGRSGTRDAQVYLVSPEVAAATALCGHIADPRSLGESPEVELPERFRIDDSGVLPPADEAEAAGVEIVRGPNIRPMPLGEPLGEEIAAPLTLKAVSYTHLDVYKRQRLFRLGFQDEQFDGSVRARRSLLGAAPDEEAFFCQQVLSTCLLYTSRCV